LAVAQPSDPARSWVAERTKGVEESGLIRVHEVRIAAHRSGVDYACMGVSYCF
jgi:hypothetical protein